MDEGLLRVALSSTLVLAGIGISWLCLKRHKRFPFPPGPKGWPLVGNFLDMPDVKEWETYFAWSQTYGELSNSNLVLMSNAEPVQGTLYR
jgi:hypothetical protein